MSFAKITRGIFALKQQPPQKEAGSASGPVREKIIYTEYGFQQAGRLGGSIAGLNVCLQKIYQDFKQEIKDNDLKQEELKRPYMVKREDHKGDISRLDNKIEKVRTETIPVSKRRVEELKEELSHIRKNPQEVIGDDAGSASFYIGSIILSFLTVYLFVFYSSASYSAFFKIFSMNEIGVANSIFDSKALTKALEDGITELVLILTIPFVFLSLGYLIHKFQEQKGAQKYLKISMLVIITFLFDGILGYEITEKIYNIKQGDNFGASTPYSIGEALHSINFWLIIFAGFVVYLIWGFVFDFVIEAFGKRDKIKVAINEKNKQIKDGSEEIKDLEMQIDKMTHAVAEHQKEIKKLNRILESSIVPREFAVDIYGFMEGWLGWMRGSGRKTEDLDEAKRIAEGFVDVTLYNIETI